MKKIIIILLLFVTTYCSALTPSALIDSANINYKKSFFEKAIKQYEAVIDCGFQSSELYYNLGNSYFRFKNLPKAILYYEKAKLIAPDDEEINFNLNLANSLIIDKVNAVPEFFVSKWIKNAITQFNSNTWAIISLTIFIISLAFLLLFLFSKKIILRKIFFWVGVFLLMFTVFSTYSSISTKNNITNNNSAIIMKSVTTAKSSPSDSSTDLFIVHEGTKIIIRETVEDWSEIKLSDGNIGWLKVSDYERI